MLYTAYAPAINPAGPIVGLLVDEWTETIPAKQETTALTFHYDRPNCEAPQSMLLVTPSTMRGVWTWQEVVASLHEALDLARLARSRARPARSARLRAIPTGHGGHVDVPSGDVCDQLRRAGESGGDQWLDSRRSPSICQPSRCGTGSKDGRARSNFDRALKAEVADALWMISKQWQMGEFIGDDAGSPVLAKALFETTRLTKYKAGDEPAAAIEHGSAARGDRREPAAGVRACRARRSRSTSGC